MLTFITPNLWQKIFILMVVDKLDKLLTIYPECQQTKQFVVLAPNFLGS